MYLPFKVLCSTFTGDAVERSLIICINVTTAIGKTTLVFNGLTEDTVLIGSLMKLEINEIHSLGVYFVANNTILMNKWSSFE